MIYYFNKTKCQEYFIPDQEVIVYKFFNKKCEKHFFDGRKYIRYVLFIWFIYSFNYFRYSDGKVKIIGKYGEEIIELNDGRKYLDGITCTGSNTKTCCWY